MAKVKAKASSELRFDLTTVYTTPQVAEMFGKSVSHVREKWIKTSKLKYFPDGNKELITGQWILDMVQSESGFYDEQPPTNRGGHKKRSKSNQRSKSNN